MAVTQIKMPEMAPCIKCGYMSSPTIFHETTSNSVHMIHRGAYFLVIAFEILKYLRRIAVTVTRYEKSSNTHSSVPKIMFVVTTPFAANAFLAEQIAVLSKKFRIILCTNCDAYNLFPIFQNTIEVHHISFSRRVSLGSDITTLLELTALVLKVRPAVSPNKASHAAPSRLLTD